MLAIKECLIREGVLNLTSTANHGTNDSSHLPADAAAAANGGVGVGGAEGDGGAAAAAGANSTSVYRNKYNNDIAISNGNGNISINNLRAISANYTHNNENRNNRNYDIAAATPQRLLALDSDFQLARLKDQKSVDTTHSHNINTNNENVSSNCSVSSASATAKSSCQQSSIYDKSKYLQQQQQRVSSKEQSQQQTGTKAHTRYQGVHPHFHHHTAPAYYTDVNLHIHTPKANDGAALNENYQSVYNTPSHLVNEHYFPKTTTATVVPPPIGTGTAAIGRANTTSPTSVAKRDRERIFSPDSALSSHTKSSNSSVARAAFFRGGSAGSSVNSGERKKCETFVKSSPAFGRPAKKGEFNDNEHSYTPYDTISGSTSFVVDTQSSECSKSNNNNQLDNTIDTYKTQHNSKNYNIPITSPTSAGNTSASASASVSASASGRSRHTNRFAGKKRAVRVRSESRPISALYDIICKEKGLDIGTSTTNEEDSSSATSNEDECRSAHNKRNNSNKEHSRQRSISRNSNRNNSNDYTEISNCLTAFVANSLPNYLGGHKMENAAKVASAASDPTKASHDRSKRAHKSRTPNSQKSGSKKRKDLGKTKAAAATATTATTAGMRSASDEELNGETSEDSNERRAYDALSPRSRYRADCSRPMNGTEKASSLPPRLHSSARTDKQASHQHMSASHANAADSNTYTKCPLHCRCPLLECESYDSSSAAHRSSHYHPLEDHQSSLPPPPNLSSGPCSSICSTNTATAAGDDDNIMVVNSLGYSPDKLYFEPVNMNLSGISSSAASGKNANSSSSGVVVEQTSSTSSARSQQRISRAQQRRLREEMRRNTDLPQLDSLSPAALSSQLAQAERALSEDEGVAGVNQQKSRGSKARRFINRPSRTPSRGRTGNSVNGSPHPIRRNTQHSESSSSPSSPAPAHHSAAAANDNSLSGPVAATPPPPPPTNIIVQSIAGVTIEDVGSASSADHITHIKLSPLQIMTNSATPATELRPPANGSAALGEAHPAETEMHSVVNEEAGTANIGVQVAISAANALHPRKYEAHIHKTPSNTITTRPFAKTSTTTIATATTIISNKPPTTFINQHNSQQLQQQHRQPKNNKSNNRSSSSPASAVSNTSHNNNSNNSYAMPTETFLLKQKAAMLAGNGTNTCIKKKPLSPLQIISIPPTSTAATTAHQLSHQHNATPHTPRSRQQYTGYITQLPQRRQSPLLGAPLSPFSLARSPLSPCSPPHYVRPTKASRLRAAALDKKKYEDEIVPRPRSPCYGSPISPRTSASPKHQSPRLSTSSSSDHPRGPTAGSESDTKLKQNVSPTAIENLQPTASPTAIGTPRSISPMSTANKKLVPSVSVSVKQNLSELRYNGDINTIGSPKKSAVSKLKNPRSTTTPSPSTECTAKFTRTAGRLSTAEDTDSHLLLKADETVTRPRTSTMKSGKSKSTNDLKPDSCDNSPNKLELSPVKSATPGSPMEDRDKSSKRKSNLNRSLNDEATVDSDDSLAARRRRRRELGLVRQLVPADDLILREMLLPHQNKLENATEKSAATPPSASSKSPQTELAYHMEMARRGLDLVNPSVSNRARSETKYDLNSCEAEKKEKSSNMRLARRSDTLHLGELRKLRSNDVNRKVNERTKSDLAEIKKIAEQANVEMAMMASGIATELAEQTVPNADYEHEAEKTADRNECVADLTTSSRYNMRNRVQVSSTPPPAPSFIELEVAAEAREHDPSPAKHATFVQEERIYYHPEASDQVSKSVSNSTMASGILRQRILKARSMERDAGHEPPKLSPILRRRSTDDPSYMAAPTSATGMHSTSPSTTSHNHIVSILKKKDHIAGESSSASSNASPVTFSANVVDTPSTNPKRAGILKKRSSLDESRYYSRSHSPDERSILTKSARRNSLEETAGIQQQQQQHGILKQSSYESSKSDGCPSATEPHPHGILKKKDSTSTPSDGGSHVPKHVSISQAVQMAAAELYRETADSQFAAGEHEESGYTPSNDEYEIRPILKLESASSDDAMRPPKPILKKKSSGDSDEYEIRPILKTSRKSSREEFDLGGSLSEDGRHYSEPPPPTVRPILKTDSPSKRRSLGGEELAQEASGAENASESPPSLLKRRTRSLERQEPPVVDLAAALNAIASSQATPVDFVSTPITTGGSISVAERIKNMEKFLNSNGVSPATPTDPTSSWESPLQAGMTPRLLKPSAIRRDMYRDRYKTQPVTNDEKMLFKATASPLDTSATSAFKPTNSLDAGLNYTTFAHLNAPSAASSASAGSSYKLTRCATQPLHSQHYFNAVGSGAAASTPPLRATIGRLNSLSDSYNNSVSEQLTLSLGSDSERIFEMSGIEGHSGTPTEATKNEGGDAEVGSAAAGLTRRNSVRARANMFQQLQEKTRSTEAAAAALATAATALNREERTSPRRAPRQLSPTPATPATPPISISSAADSSDEPKTPQNPPRTDEEIEPTSLPVSARLRFFTNLTQAANRSASNSYTRSPPQRYLSTDRCGSANSYSNNNSFTFTPRSSYNGSGSTSNSSASVTPIPMECYSPPLLEPQLISINEIDSALHMEHNGVERNGVHSPPHETSAFIRLAKSSSQTLLPSVLAQRLAMSAPAPATTPEVAVISPSTLTPVARRIKMKTIGKLLLPQTFLNNERNSNQHNNNSSSNNNNNNNMSGSINGNIGVNGCHNDTCDSECSSIESGSKPPPLKKIGKIKSPFIENCLQMQQKHHQLNSKCMKYDHKSTPHNNALAALENNVTNGVGGERDTSSLPLSKPLQNGNTGVPTLRVHSNNDNNADSGKENNYCDSQNAAPVLILSPHASSISVTEQSRSPVVEMRKKFSRIMSNSSLSALMLQRHTTHAVSANDSGSTASKLNVSAVNSSSSSAPTTPRNSIIDEKFAKYFGLTPSAGSHNQRATTNAANKAAANGSGRAQSNTSGARQLGASEKSATPRSTPNYPPLSQADFRHATNGATHVGALPPSGYDAHSTPLEAVNHHVRSNSNTSYYIPPGASSYGTATMVSTNGSAAVHATTSGSANALQRRRDMAKRQRANTTNVTFTPTTSVQAATSAQANAATTSTGRARVLRTRALTLTHGVPLPEVKRYEDIVVTKEEFQLASKEFERIFLGII